MLVVGFDWRRRKQYGTALEFVLVLGSFIGLHEWTSLSLVRIQKIQTQSGMKLFSTIFSQNVSSKIISKLIIMKIFVVCRLRCNDLLGETSSPFKCSLSFFGI
jgi:hypothetical protein